MSTMTHAPGSQPTASESSMLDMETILIAGSRDGRTDKSGSCCRLRSDSASSSSVHQATTYIPAAFERADSNQGWVTDLATSDDSDDSQSYTTAESQAFHTPAPSEHEIIEEVRQEIEATELPIPGKDVSSKTSANLVAQDTETDLGSSSLAHDAVGSCNSAEESASPKVQTLLIVPIADSLCSATKRILDAQSPTKMTEQTSAPNDTKVMDWVEQQALGDGIDNIVGDVNKTLQDQQAPNPDGKVYDIPTLLDICASVDLDKIHLRIHQGALHENIFKATKVLPTSRRHIRSRGLSEVSQKSIDSNEDDVLLVGHLSYPVRQPHAAPKSMSTAQKQGFRYLPIRQPKRPPPNMIGARVEGFLSFPQKLPLRQPISPPAELAQQHAGFQRFLKEHASPPHQRVTAGGRIVPAHGPPPVFNVNSLTGAIMSPSRSATATTTHTVKSNETSKGVENASGPRFASVASRHGIRVSGASEHSGINRLSAPLQDTTNQDILRGLNQQTQANTPMQQPLNPAPIMLLQDGTTFVMQNGLPYRVYSNGFQTFTESVPLLYAQQSVAPEFPKANGFQQGIPPQPDFALPFGEAQNQSFNSDSMLSSYLLQLRQGSSEQTLQQQHEYLRNELQSLDKYIALHGKRFGRHEHLAFVALRKQLVQELDRYRRRLGGTSTSEATSQPYQYTSLGAQPGLRRSTDASIFHRYGSSGTRQFRNLESQTRALPRSDSNAKAQLMPDTVSNNGFQQLKTPSVKSSAGTSKVLSPEAPPFIPGSMRKIPARKVESCIPNSDSKDILSESRAASSSKDITLQMAYKENIAHAQSFQNNAVESSPGRVTHTRYGTSGSWSAMEALAPDVHEKDIAYVNDLGLNPAYGTKKYCSSVLEFQEVIRRVREQARLYGCKGGSSKDPEFDAEQDIRWAISDSTPVPLPKKIPDHIAYPRPWCWNDSAFNIDADRSKVHNTSPPATQQATRTGSGTFEANAHETTPKAIEYPSQRSLTAGSNVLGSTVSGNDASKSPNQFPFHSSRQAMILRETHNVLSNIVSNSLANNASSKQLYVRQMDGKASPRNFDADEASLKDPSESIEPTQPRERHAANYSRANTSNTSSPRKLIVKLPYAQPSGSSDMIKSPNPEFEARVGDRRMFRNSEQPPTSTPSLMGFGSSTFLGKLLKSPLFSSAKASHNQQDPGKPTEYAASHPHGMTQNPYKENSRLEKGVYGAKYPVYTRSAAINQNSGLYHDYGFGKSRSLVAPTNTNAHAQMQTQSGKPEGPFQSSEWRIRHHPPSPVESSRGVSVSGTHGPDRRSAMPQYDGANDGPSSQTKSGDTKPEKVGKKTERDELDPGEFQTDKNVLPSGHEYAVNRFLDNLRKAEHTNKAKHPSKGPN